MLNDILKAVLISALSCIGTIIISQIVLYIKETGKKAKMRKRQELQEVLKESIKEEIGPLTEEMKEIKNDNELIKKGLQSLIKTDLQNEYDEWIRKGYAPIHIKNELEKLYWVYHNLGKNGVMDSLRETFNKLPNELK